MIQAREYLDANSMMQQCFEQDVLMHLKGLQIQAPELWGFGQANFFNNLLLNSYDPQYQLQLVLKPLHHDSKLDTKQLSQVAKLLRVLPSKDIAIRLDLGGTNNRVFLRILKSIFRKSGLLSKLTFKPVDCQGTTWVEILSAFRKTQPSKVTVHMIESQFYLSREKLRNVFHYTLKNAQEFSFQTFPLKVTNRFGWFADTQRTMDIFKNLRKISINPFSLEDPDCYNYQRLFKTFTNLEELSLICYNRYYFRLSDTHLTFPPTLKRLNLIFATLWDKDSMKNIFNSIFTKQEALQELEDLQIVIKYQPTPAMSQVPPILNEYSFLRKLVCPNLKTLRMHLDLVRKISLVGLEKLSKLETFNLTLGYNVEKIKFADNQPFPNSLKRFKFHYDPEKPMSDYKREIYHSFMTFFTKLLKDPASNFANNLVELHFGEVLANSELMQSICIPSLETLSFNRCLISEKDLTKLLNDERLLSLKTLRIQESHIRRDKWVVNEELFQIITDSSIANQLEELSLESMEFIEENLDRIQLAGRCLPNLKRLNLWYAVRLTIKGLTKILQIEMPQLEYLNIEYIRCSYLSLQPFLLKLVPHLKELKLDAGQLQIDESWTMMGTRMTFKTKFLKITNFGVFKSKM